MLTMSLKKPEKTTLEIDHTAFEELHFGELPCIWLRPGPGIDIGLQPGETKKYTGLLTILTIPAGFRRIDSARWKEDMASSYGKSLTTNGYQSNSFFLLYDLAEHSKGKRVKYLSVEPDFCEVNVQSASLSDERADLLIADGTDSPCVKILQTSRKSTSTGRSTSSTNGNDVLACSYDYYNNVSKSKLKKLLRKKYFKRGGRILSGKKGKAASQKKVKLLATLIPGRGIVWLPVIGEKPDYYDEFIENKVGQFISYHTTFLDGPNIWIGRLKKKRWGRG